MSLTFNGTTPMEIIYNGTSLTDLKQGSTFVWGKPYALSISAGSNTTVTVNRTSSPKMNAATGAITSGSLVYYGDVLTITANANGNYTLSKFQVNGVDKTSPCSITISGAVSIITAATSAPSASSWKTMWTGSVSMGGLVTINATAISSKAGTAFGTDIDFNRPTKISGTIEQLSLGTSDFNSNELTSAFKFLDSLGTGLLTELTVCAEGRVESGTLYIQRSASQYGGSGKAVVSITITKIDQYC